jgi:hypothetical protein
MAVNVKESILESTKTAMGIVPEYDAFNDQLLKLINSAFSTLSQIGIGPDDGFFIEDESTTWDEFLDGKRILNFVIQYVHIYVRLSFDPPQNSFAVQSMKQQLDELTWRINVQAEKMNKKT